MCVQSRKNILNSLWPTLSHLIPTTMSEVKNFFLVLNVLTKCVYKYLDARLDLSFWKVYNSNVHRLTWIRKFFCGKAIFYSDFFMPSSISVSSKHIWEKSCRISWREVFLWLDHTAHTYSNAIIFSAVTSRQEALQCFVEVSLGTEKIFSR